MSAKHILHSSDARQSQPRSALAVEDHRVHIAARPSPNGLSCFGAPELTRRRQGGMSLLCGGLLYTTSRPKPLAGAMGLTLGGLAGFGIALQESYMRLVVTDEP